MASADVWHSRRERRWPFPLWRLLKRPGCCPLSARPITHSIASGFASVRFFSRPHCSMRHDDPRDHQHARDQHQQVEVVRRTSARALPGVEAHGNVSRDKAPVPPRAAARPARQIAIGPQAAFFCSICLLSFEGVLPAIWMRRGFIASGISRTSSIFSSPFSKLAPFTCT